MLLYLFGAIRTLPPSPTPRFKDIYQYVFAGGGKCVAFLAKISQLVNSYVTVPSERLEIRRGKKFQLYYRTALLTERLEQLARPKCFTITVPLSSQEDTCKLNAGVKNRHPILCVCVCVCGGGGGGGRGSNTPRCFTLQKSGGVGPQLGSCADFTVWKFQ